ncbi:transcription factor Dp-2 [Exaiptasia diaphana]|uniref:E2F/DP family winged-helix DNA-binding domain-containing protein n=1 Tax=Exaiptasia diaphana TaxID=2652724 RepID=A0A913YVZ7_EXADI|nr:transcription factor Dp-2 [Exaiptasia diaphana]
MHKKEDESVVLPLSQGDCEASRDTSTRSFTGLRTYGKLVCEILERKGTATFDEILDEIDNGTDKEKATRRIYDVLNVFQAMDIISRNGRNINWLGYSQEEQQMKAEKEGLEKKVEKKTKELEQLFVQLQHFSFFFEFGVVFAQENLDTSTRSFTGLRTYGKLVCEILERKGTATFDEILDEIDNGTDKEKATRRIYDVLNVFQAMDIISRNGRNINWLGYSQEEQQMKAEKEGLEKKVEKKTKELEQLFVQSETYTSLLLSKKNVVKDQQQGVINLPFIAVRTSKNTKIQCYTSSDGFQYLFKFERPFDILDNTEVLQRMLSTYNRKK